MYKWTREYALAVGQCIEWCYGNESRLQAFWGLGMLLSVQKVHGPRDCGSPLEPAASGSSRRDTRLGPLFTFVCSPSSTNSSYILPLWSFRRRTMKAISLPLLRTPLPETTPFSTTRHPPSRTTSRPRPTINHWLDKNERGRGTLWQTDESAWNYL
jgi:hypothetical protein